MVSTVCGCVITSTVLMISHELQAYSLPAKPQGKPERKAEARCNSNAVTRIHSPTKYLVVSFCDDEAQGKHHSKMCCSGMWIIFSWKQAGSESSLCPIASKYLFTQHYLPEITLLLFEVSKRLWDLVQNIWYLFVIIPEYMYTSSCLAVFGILHIYVLYLLTPYSQFIPTSLSPLVNRNFEMQYLDAISKTTEWSLFISKANHSISR